MIVSVSISVVIKTKRCKVEQRSAAYSANHTTTRPVTVSALDREIAKLEARWHLVPRAVKRQLAAKYGITKYQLAAKVAWYHGKLRGKRLIDR